MIALHGCTSSPGAQLESISVTRSTPAAPSTADDSVELAAKADNQPSDIAAQAEKDAELLTREVPTPDTTETAQLDVAGQVMAPTGVDATRNSLFATPSNRNGEQTLNYQAAQLSKKGRVAAQPLNATRNSIFAGTETPVTKDNTAQMRLPVPDADAVETAQSRALKGFAEKKALAARQEIKEMEVANADPVPGFDQLARAAETKPQAEEPRKSRTLADFFRSGNSGKKDTKTASFDQSRFAKDKKKTLNTRAIPNMQTAALSDQALPGVTTNAMMPVGDVDNHDAIEDADEPAGLMKLVALPGMMRMSKNGLWRQTERVNISCLRPQLVSMLKNVESHYKRPVVVTSGYRDVKQNRRAGGARHSLHTLCAAADIQVQGVTKWDLAEYLRSLPGRGGVGTYCHTQSVHIDVGGERDWNWRCRRSKRRS